MDDGHRALYLDARAGLAYPLTERVFVGLTGRYAKITQDGTLREGGLGDSSVSGGLREWERREARRPARLRRRRSRSTPRSPSRRPTACYIAVVGQNLSYPDHGLLPTTVGGGIGFGTDDFSIEVDGLADFNSYRDTTFRFMAGGEYLVADHFPLRAGYRFDQGADQHALSLGARLRGHPVRRRGHRAAGARRRRAHHVRGRARVPPRVERADPRDVRQLLVPHAPDGDLRRAAAGASASARPDGRPPRPPSRPASPFSPRRACSRSALRAVPDPTDRSTLG